MKNKKGQLVGQIFVFVLAAIIFGLILLFGFRAIQKVGDTRADVQLIEFEQQLASQVKKVSVNFGSVKKLELSLPSDFREVCFVDLETVKQPEKFNALQNKNQLIADAIQSGSDQNVFTIPLAETPLKSGPLEIEDGFLCVPNSATSILLRIEGRGDRVKLSEFPRE